MIGWDDPNLDKDMIVLEDDSPYPEVRASVSNTDDPDIPASTLRSWVIGLIFAILVPGKSHPFRVALMYAHIPDSRSQPVLLLPLSLCVNQQYCSTADDLPYWPPMGRSHAKQEDIWSFNKPRSIHCQGTCVSRLPFQSRLSILN